ncbi:MAG: ABC transporter substrate-binding protein [Candidatus Rokubacteria bacterium]|nr:ABC transporter substrate-binding protein [Candidatus Rokubacteria bacterium]
MKVTRPILAVVALTLTLACGVLGAPLAADGQPAASLRRVGLLGPAEEPRFSEIAGSLKQGLREQGYAEDGVEILARRVRRGDKTGAQAAVEGLVRQRTEVLFVIGSVLAKEARQVAPKLPIVFLTPGDPVAAGLVSSLARPGGNMTAMTFEYPELSGKRLQLLKELAPGVRRVLALYDPRDASPRQGAAAAREAASVLGLTLVEREVRSPADVQRGLEALEKVDALLGIPGGLTAGYYEAMIRTAHAKKRPTIFQARTGSTADALATYGASDADIAREAARLVAKILLGANAGDLPVERPSKVRFVINLKTAKGLGLTIPPSVLIRADEVIE